ncbi:MAG: transcriptional repressor [Coriobacteriia bacterium]|nr:transcriptional repressor [Coriobacteriia bacterium]
MSVAPDEISRRVELLTGALRRQGFRLTHQRLEIVRELAATDEHPDVEAIFNAVRGRVPTVSLDTVYRTLGTLVDIGVVARVTATAGPARYDANLAEHHHFVCTRCGLVRDVVDPALDAVRAAGATSTFGTVETVDVHLRGICRRCEAQTSA